MNGEKAYFLFTTRGPRASFPGDITPAEQALMSEHVAYWKRQFEAGYVVVFGPVFDPVAPRGMAVLECADEVAARGLAEADPAVSGRLLEMDLAAMRVGSVRR